MLRIDDTDEERSRPEYERQLIEDLRWLGLDWDEGPDKGLSVSYRQSERGTFYDEVLQILREGGAIYPCFCSEERLENLRREQRAKDIPPRYDGLCRRLTPEEISRRTEAGEKPCWRFALPDKAIAFHDVVRGELSFAPDMGDFVVARSDGHPTYLFTSVVDDHLMEITHIVRGDEHVPNTARQQALFDALGWKAPIYAHIPMILSEDRQKLSKRTGSTPIRRYRGEGYLPEALTAYLATLSWTLPEGLEHNVLLSLSEAASIFSLSRISVSLPVHDEAHLKYWQKEAMKKRGGEFILKQLTEADPRFSDFDAAMLKRLIEDLLEESYTLPLLQQALNFLVEKPRAQSEPWLSELRQMLRSSDPWSEENLNRELRAFMKERGLKGKEFFHPLRLILTGQESGAALTLILCVLGRDKTVDRLV